MLESKKKGDSVAVKKMPIYPRSFYWSLPFCQNFFEQLTPVMLQAKKLLHLGAVNKRLNAKEEATLGAKIAPLIFNSHITPKPLLPKEFEALECALALSYILVTRYPEVCGTVIPQTLVSGSPKKMPYEINFLYFAQHAVKYGAANCDGHAAVTLYLLLKQEWCTQLESICISNVDGKHAFIMVTSEKLGEEAVVIDPYHEIVKPLSKAIKDWKAQGYENGKVSIKAKIQNIQAFLLKEMTKAVLKKLDEAVNSRDLAKDELNWLKAKFVRA